MSEEYLYVAKKSHILSDALQKATDDLETLEQLSLQDKNKVISYLNLFNDLGWFIFAATKCIQDSPEIKNELVEDFNSQRENLFKMREFVPFDDGYASSSLSSYYSVLSMALIDYVDLIYKGLEGENNHYLKTYNPANFHIFLDVLLYLGHYISRTIEHNTHRSDARISTAIDAQLSYNIVASANKLFLFIINGVNLVESFYNPDVDLTNKEVDILLLKKTINSLVSSSVIIDCFKIYDSRNDTREMEKVISEIINQSGKLNPKKEYKPPEDLKKFFND